jgi:hypothetical protein
MLAQPAYGYRAPVQTSAIQQPSSRYGSPAIGQSYTALATAADKERLMQAQRATGRQNAVIGGYEQQMANSQLMGQQAYNQLSTDYGLLTADAAATRDRNMARIDQYGNSMRQDLDLKNRQALAAASQSAIQRGLGNTTIQNSLVRGQNFDNQRQQLSLEDQLLQNRIATDSQLSGVYQGALQNRAQGLNNQFNQNIQNDNSLAGQKLGYIGGIQENMDGFNTVSNLYTQLWQMENANAQAQLDREERNPGLYRGYGNIGKLGKARTAWR